MVVPAAMPVPTTAMPCWISDIDSEPSSASVSLPRVPVGIALYWVASITACLIAEAATATGVAKVTSAPSMVAILPPAARVPKLTPAPTPITLFSPLIVAPVMTMPPLSATAIVGVTPRTWIGSALTASVGRLMFRSLSETKPTLPPSPPLTLLLSISTLRSVSLAFWSTKNTPPSPAPPPLPAPPSV